LPSCGAVATFLGTTRDSFEGKKVTQLFYECYEKMAMKELQKIAFELRGRWTDIGRIVLVHRIGVVPVCEASVAIVVSSPHRKSALEAVATAIDLVKSQVPIWKKEFYADDSESATSVWKGNSECFFKPS